jgi:hypothetical protein
MNLRKITIWTTGITLIGTFIMLFAFLTATSFHANFGLAKFFMGNSVVLAVPFYFLMFCFYAGFPLCFPMFVSWVMLRFMKHSVSLILLLIPTIIWDVWMPYALYLGLYEFWGSDMNGIQFFGFAFGWCFCMIPVWITAIVIEVWHRRKNKQQTESLEDKS